MDGSNVTSDSRVETRQPLAASPGPLRRVLSWVVLGAVGAVLLACSHQFLSGRSGGVRVARGPRIDHAAHLDKGLECADCHGKGVEPEKPTYAACSDCHDDEDEKKPEAKKIKNWFFRPDGSPAWVQAAEAYDPEIRFLHAPHVKSTACATCHGALKGAQRAEGRLFTMERCMACHAMKGASNACEACHVQITTETQPANHAHLWKERHGQFLRSTGLRFKERCDLCHHEPSFCDGCHRIEEPANHTNLFRTRTHGVLAAIDRTSCQVCHETDFCVRCHEETAPRSHTAGWSGVTSRHCLTCHFPLNSQQQCSLCHFEQPQHDTAPDMPPEPFHVPGANCRGCHTPAGGGAPALLHPDNGMSCEVCHH